MTAKLDTPLPPIERASLDRDNRIVLLFSQAFQGTPELSRFCITPDVPLKTVRQDSHRRLTLIGGPFDRKQPHFINIDKQQAVPVLPDGILDSCTTDAPMGLTWSNKGAILRFFAPRAREVDLLLYTSTTEDAITTLPMTEESTTGCWIADTDQLKPGMLYGYRVRGTNLEQGVEELIFADPYGWAIAKKDAWPRPSLTVAHDPALLRLPPATHVTHPSRQLIIYEAHLRDATRLDDQLEATLRGSYPGAADPERSRFLSHLKRLGANTVEWLPLQDYDYHEPPYTPTGGINDWNPTAVNHWGYMPAYYFAPEARYASRGGQGTTAGWIGTNARQILETRQLVQACHNQGIAVILDVVYNHVAQYGENPLRQIDPHYFLRHDGKGNRLGYSGCGNDLATERPMVRRLIVDSLKHWMTFYGIDGFRFDLAGLIDEGTLDSISNELRAIYPEVHLIAEPWGGLYDKSRFVRRNWASWNDHFRDGLRGFEPIHSKTWLFQQGYSDILRHLKGDRIEEGGPFKEASQTVNYLACHDGYTLPDFIRLANGDAKPGETFSDQEDVPLSSMSLATLRLAFLLLLTSRGMVMIHQGDEWARAKRIDGPSEKAGMLDHDSYNRDDRTNWIDWISLEEHPDRQALVDYIGQLARIRLNHPSLTTSRPENLSLLPSPSPRAFGYRTTVASDSCIVLANSLRRDEVTFPLPAGSWKILAGAETADAKRGISGVLERKISLPPQSGMILTAV
ncbi:hypothetical protein KQI63_03130 [bacterium]|nr:hypothetical protein [bacterium]